MKIGKSSNLPSASINSKASVLKHSPMKKVKNPKVEIKTSAPVRLSTPLRGRDGLTPFYAAVCGVTGIIAISFNIVSAGGTALLIASAVATSTLMLWLWNQFKAKAS